MKLKLSPVQVSQIREQLKRGISQRIIADSFGISQPMVSYIGRGLRKNYLSVTDKTTVIKPLD